MSRTSHTHKAGPVRAGFMAAAALGAAAVLVGGPGGLEAQAHEQAADEAAIRQVVLGAYVDGMHGNGDRGVIRAGFHPDFVMKVLGQDGGVSSVTIEDWIARLPPEGEEPRYRTTGEVPRIMMDGNVAVAEVVVSREGARIFTDYISLYRFPEGWRMVAKVFYSYPRS